VQQLNVYLQKFQTATTSLKFDFLRLTFTELIVSKIFVAEVGIHSLQNVMITDHNRLTLRVYSINVLAVKSAASL